MTPPKNVLITGGNRGLGRGIARALAAAGWRVFITARNPADLATALADLNADRPFIPVDGLRLDVADEASVADFEEEIASRLDCLHVLYNNAGVHHQEGDRSILQEPAWHFTSTFATNAVGPILVTRAVLPLLRAARGARIINVSSTLGQLSRDVRDLAAAYSVSKSALNAAGLLLAAALAHESITVVSTCPGHTRTDMGGEQAPRSLAEGIDTPVWLATTAPADLTGVFVKDRQIQPW